MPQPSKAPNVKRGKRPEPEEKTKEVNRLIKDINCFSKRLITLREEWAPWEDMASH